MARKRTRFSKKKLLEAIEGSNGIISVIAKRLDCNWHTAKKNVDSDEANPDVRKAFQDETDKILDVAEGVILKGMTGKNMQIATQTAKWYLANKGKVRGYGSEDMSVNANVSFVDDVPLDDDETAGE